MRYFDCSRMGLRSFSNSGPVFESIRPAGVTTGIEFLVWIESGLMVYPGLSGKIDWDFDFHTVRKIAEGTKQIKEIWKESNGLPSTLF